MKTLSLAGSTVKRGILIPNAISKLVENMRKEADLTKMSLDKEVDHPL